MNDWYVIVTNNRDLDVELTKFPSFNKACEAMLADLNDEKHTQTFGNKVNTQVTILPDNTGATLLTENGLEYTWRITTETKTDESWYMLTTNNRNDDVKLKRYENLVLAQQAMRQAMVTDAKRTKENGIRTKITIWPNDRGGRLTTETGASRTWHLIKLTED